MVWLGDGGASFLWKHVMFACSLKLLYGVCVKYWWIAHLFEVIFDYSLSNITPSDLICLCSQPSLPPQVSPTVPSYHSLVTKHLHYIHWSCTLFSMGPVLCFCWNSGWLCFAPSHLLLFLFVLQIWYPQSWPKGLHHIYRCCSCRCDGPFCHDWGHDLWNPLYFLLGWWIPWLLCNF